MEHAARRLRRPRAGTAVAGPARAHVRDAPAGRRRTLADFRSALRDIFGTRLELRLGDPLDSEIDRKVAQLVPGSRPGRGIMTGKYHFLGALPRVDGRQDAASLGDGVEDLIKRSTAAWRGPAGPKLRLLPGRISLEDVRAQAGEDTGRLLLGINEKELAPIGLDHDTEPHLLVLGDGQSGMSTLLRSLIKEIARTRTPKEAQIIAVDYRRSLLGEIPSDYQLDYLTSATLATPAMKDLAEYLTYRLPGPDVTPDQLRNRSWWTGADAYVLVDDYDLVATQQGSPLAPLAPLLAQARDIGLHVIITRRSGGASRAMYESVIQTMRDLSMPGLLLSGSPDEGALLGNIRPTPQPPGRGRLITRERGLEVAAGLDRPPALTLHPRPGAKSRETTPTRLVVPGLSGTSSRVGVLGQRPEWNISQCGATSDRSG